MRLTQFSNYAIRILMYAGLRGPVPSAVPEMARAYGISYDHLKKAAAELCRLGYLETVRGRSGGVRLSQPPESIRVGTVVRQTEGEVVLVECFDPGTNSCPITAACRLRLALHEAVQAFFGVLDGYTLADLIEQPHQLIPLLGLDPAGPAGPAAGDAEPPALTETPSPAPARLPTAPSLREGSSR